MKKRIVLLFAAVFLPAIMMAQQDSIVSMSDNLHNAITKSMDTVQKWEFHATLGSSIVGGSLGTASVFSVNPTIVYRPNKRLTVKASATGFDSYCFPDAGAHFRGREARSLAPYRDRGSVAGAVSVSASYKVTDRLWVAASYMHLGGEVATGAVLCPWMATPMPVTLDANAFSASLRYRFGEKSFIDIHFTHIDDRAGTLAPMLFDAYYHDDFNHLGHFNQFNPFNN